MDIFWFGVGWFACCIMFFCIDVLFKKKSPSMCERLEAIKDNEKLEDMLDIEQQIWGFGNTEKDIIRERKKQT